VLHAAHALASSAWVVGEREISVLARAVEDQLLDSGSASDLPALVAALEAVAR
jgi:HPt (histidine-containing phosphotransfer) domain-containing protein